MTLLTVDDLSVHFVGADAYGRPRIARALNGVSFTVGTGEVLGLVGETGAGKSLTANAVMGLLRPPARRVSGAVFFEGQDLTALDEAAMNRLRGARMALVVQSPKTSLDPLTRVGDQIVRARLAHTGKSQTAARERAFDLLRAVGIPAPEQRARAWPHELSGGMAQRVLIAMALANDPTLLIADEPTTGLDVTVQAQILDLLRETVRARRAGLVIITHDLGVVAQYCDRVAVMYAGTIVESGPVGAVLARPQHPYSRALIAATPERIAAGATIPRAGPPPDLYALPSGCVYSTRCALADAACSAPPPAVAFAAGQMALCHHMERRGDG